MKHYILIIAGIIALLLLMYGSFWLAKNLSYQWWYEDLVIQTIKEYCVLKP